MCAPWLALASCSSPVPSPDANDLCDNVPAAEIRARESGGLPTDIAIDAGHIYWVAFRGHKVQRLSKQANAAVEMVAIDETPMYLAVDDVHVYWINGIGDVKRSPKAGGAVETLATAAGCGNMSPCGVALVLDDQAVYWTEKGTPATVFRLTKIGGTLTALATTGLMTEKLALDGDHVYFGSVSVDGMVRQELRRVPKLGGPAETVAVFAEPISDTAVDIAFDSTHLYVARETGIWTVAKDGGDTRRLAEVAMPRRITVDQNSLYVSRASTVEVIRLDTEQVEAVACDQRSARSLVADEVHVYWVDEGAETINVAKKRQ